MGGGGLVTALDRLAELVDSRLVGKEDRAEAERLIAELRAERARLVARAEWLNKRRL